MNPKNPQRGISLISLLFLLFAVMFVGIIGVRVGPVYMEHSSIKSILKSMIDERGLYQMSAFEIRKTFDKRLYMNNIRSVKAKQLDVKRTEADINLNLAYEVRVPVIGNVDAVIHFKDQFQAGRNNDDS